MKKAILDLVERAGATFAQAFLAAITIDASGITQLDAVKVAAVAGGYAVGKFLLVKVSTYLNKPEPVMPPEPVHVVVEPADSKLGPQRPS